MTDREKLLRLADFMVEDIMAMSDAEILAEVTPAEIEEAKQMAARILGEGGKNDKPD